MSNDYYAESGYQLIDIQDFKEIISYLWIRIKDDRNIDWDKKAEIFINDLNKKFYSKINENLMKIRDEYQLFPDSYIKLFKVFELIYTSPHIKEDLIYKLLEQDVHDKNKIRKILNNLNFEENIIKAYKSVFQVNRTWLNISDKVKGEIKELRLDPKDIEIEDIKKISNNTIENNVFFIKINFTLKTPYISKDDDVFYVDDNPICKDKVFKVPYVRPGSWKGKLRWVASYNLLERLRNSSFRNWKFERCKLIRLFGNEKDVISSWLDQQIAQETGINLGKITNQFHSFLKEQDYISKDANRRGRLIFYPTFLDKYGLDVLAPHKRDTRTIAKTGPINLEIAPEGSKGTFALLYFPFDILWRKDIHSEVMEDLEILQKSIPDILTLYGFGAKTTAGYGLVNKEIEFQIFPYFNEIFIDETFDETEKSSFFKIVNNIKSGGINQ
ncbi:MAG: RAMP superfamily CRISPR-associated protein [Promethearchaeota archaeon]